VKNQIRAEASTPSRGKQGVPCAASSASLLTVLRSSIFRSAGTCSGLPG
jgi:hypothetical protein